MLDEARALSEQISGWRRHLHQHPELGFAEHETANFIAETLRPLGIPVRTGVGRTGVVAEVGSGDGPLVAIRADIDALPITEESGVAYCSLTPGRMHACGHDAHTAMALGAAYLLHQRGDLPGRVRFLFQPCEETEDDEGKSGAHRMIEDGAMEGVRAIIGQHVDPSAQVGDVHVSAGPIAAAPDAFWATIKGQGTHAASPQTGIDAIWLASQVLNAIYGLRGRLASPTAHAVITVGTVHGGTAENIIPSEVTLSGTIRTFDETTRARLRQGLHEACAIARAFGGDYELKISGVCPPVENDARIAGLVREEALALFDAERVHVQEPQCGADDFAVLATQAPGCYWFLGVNGGEGFYECHDPRFTLDEAALPVGTALLAASALRLLKEYGG